MSSNDSSGSDSGSEEVKKVEKTRKVCDYEKLRLKRMAENKARMEAMGLHKMASSLMGCGQIKEKGKKRDVKGKKKVGEEDDEDYEPEGDFESEGDDNDDDDDYISGGSSGTKFNKAKKKISTSSKKAANKNVSSNSNIVDDDDAALMQAIALSLQDSSGFLNVVDHSPIKSTYTRVKDCDVDKVKDTSPMKEDTGRRKRKKLTNSRVQMTEDELILHFFEFDEVGHGSITLQDLRRVAAGHDFTWSDKEMADMIQIFDRDGDGKLSLEDFTTIVGRCQMIQPVTGSKSD